MNDKTSVIEFMAERAALSAGHDLSQVRAAGESELAESADQITNKMLQKAYEFGYAKGWSDRDAAPEDASSETASC